MSDFQQYIVAAGCFHLMGCLEVQWVCRYEVVGMGKNTSTDGTVTPPSVSAAC